MTVQWAQDAIFYAVYPLGFCGAPYQSDFSAPPQPRLEKLSAWIPHLQRLGVTAVYLGPVFSSTAHGYDTADYFHVDARLGSDETLAALARDLHAAGMRVVLDGVFNHVGRDFWAFRDVREHGPRSAYCDWFAGLDFGRRSPYGDGFSYDSWNGCYDLVRLNLGNPAVRSHLFEAVRSWVERFEIDGLRLDAADCLDLAFQRELAGFCRALRPDFWLMGEVIHGDYRRWANPEGLDSVTNYEVYKGLYSSHAERNYFEIAYSLNRQFGEGGLYRGLDLFTFADNHDVNRVASNLPAPAQLYPLYCLLFTMPGIPSIYYGSEWGLEGRRTAHDDRGLRPCLDLETLLRDAPQPALPGVLVQLARIRRESPALRHGAYHPLQVSAQQLAFERRAEDQRVIVLLNAANEPAWMEVPAAGRQGKDLLNPGEGFTPQGGRLRVQVPPCWARVIQVD